MRTRRRLLVEPLEERALLSTQGVPWGDPQRISLSFVSDGTPIAAHESNLFATLAHLTPGVWQREVLWAFQSWAIQSNLNFQLRRDDGLPFGTAGLLQGDPRFGDIRLGAQRMGEEVLALSVPHDPFISGTLAGDVFLNSAHRFSPDDLYTILLHEVGHVLGLSHSDDPDSVMFSHLNRVTALSPGDIAAVRELYGARRPDSHEGAHGNDTIARATPVRFPSQGQGGYNGATPLVLFGDITTRQDVDVYAVQPIENYRGPVTFRVQSDGRSLLAPRLTIFDAAGRMLAGATSTTPGDILSAQLGAVDPDAKYYVQVQAQPRNVYSVGAYGLGITFDQQVLVPPERLDALLRGPYETLSPEDLASLALNPLALIGYDRNANDTFADATRLNTSEGAAFGFARTEVVACLGSATDVDVYRFRTPRLDPDRETVVLTASVREFPSNGVRAVIELFQEDQSLQVAELLVNGNGTYTLQVPEALAATDYFVRVRHVADGGTPGNYSLTLHFGRISANLELFAETAFTPEQSAEAYALYVAESQLFQFVFAEMQMQPPHTRMHLSLQDEKGIELFALTVRGGETITADGIFLKPGPYTVWFWSECSPQGPPWGGRSQLRGRAISDPIGPALDDPTLTPMYSTGIPGQYLYPGDILSQSPFLWVFLGGA